jgi:hypothetical protein
MFAITFYDFLNQNWGTILIALGAVGTAISGGIAWLARVTWTRVEAYWAKRDKREEEREKREANIAEKTEKLVETLTEHSPKHTKLLSRLTKTQRVIANDIVKTHEHDNRLREEILKTKEAAVDLTYAVEALSLKDEEKRQEEVQRHAKRVRERLQGSGSAKPELST